MRLQCLVNKCSYSNSRLNFWRNQFCNLHCNGESIKYFNNENTTKDIITIHKEATAFINKNIKDGKTGEVVKLLPKDIVANEDAEAKSLESFPFISGLDDSYKADVDAFQQAEVGLGILNKTISHEDLYWEA